LPPADLSNRHAEPTDSCLPVAGQSFRILVVDDDEPLRVFTSTVLEEDGYCVLNASNGEEALQICERDPASIHLLVADVVMPRLSGRQLATQFLTLYRDAKVLLISGYPSLSGVLNGIASRSEALQAQCDFLPKPFTGADLLRKVRTLLGHSIEESAETAQA
jgi:CheY-like chemotaxis protein